MSKINYTDYLKLRTYEGESVPTYLADITHNMEIIDSSFGKAVTELPSIDARLETLEDDMQTAMSDIHIQGDRLTEVEEQIKFLSPTDLGDIRDRITTAEQNIISNAESIKVLEERISNDEYAIEDNKASIEALSQQSTATNDALEEIREQIKNLETGSEGSATDISELTTKVNNLIEQNKALTGEIDGLQASDLAQANQITALAEDTKDLEVRVARLEKGGEPSDVEQIKTDLSDLEYRVSTNEVSISKLTTDLANESNIVRNEVLPHLRAVDAMIADTQNDVVNNTDRIKALEDAQGQTPEPPDLTELEGKVTKNTNDIRSLETTQDQLIDEINRNVDNIANLSQRVKALEDEPKAGLGVKEILLVNDGTYEENEERVSINTKLDATTELLQVWQYLERVDETTGETKSQWVDMFTGYYEDGGKLWISVETFEKDWKKFKLWIPDGTASGGGPSEGDYVTKTEFDTTLDALGVRFSAFGQELVEQKTQLNDINATQTSILERLEELEKSGVSVGDLVKYEYVASYIGAEGVLGKLSIPPTDEVDLNKIVFGVAYPTNINNSVASILYVSPQQLYIYTHNNADYNVTLYLKPTERVVEKEITNVVEALHQTTYTFYMIDKNEMPPIEDIKSAVIYTTTSIKFVSQLFSGEEKYNALVFGYTAGEIITKAVITYVSRET